MRTCGNQQNKGATRHDNLSCQIKFELNHFDMISLSTNTWVKWIARMAENDTNIAFKECPIEPCLRILYQGGKASHVHSVAIYCKER
jgi:hypothetical protein